MIPLQDEEATVPELLASLLLQTSPPDELVVVDAGSRDRTAQLVSELAAPFSVNIIRAGRLYPGEARNLGVEAAREDWIAFTDGGIRLEGSWLAQLMARAEDGVDVVFGSYEPVCDSFWTRASAIAYVPAVSSWGGRGPFVASMGVRKEAFQRLGGFPPYRAAEDLVFLERVAASRLRFAYAPQAIVHWRLAKDAVATFRRFAVYSHHNLAASWGRHWHVGLARLYAMLAGGMLLGLLHGVALALAMVPAFFVARALKAAWQKRGSLPIGTLAPQRVLAAGLVLLVVDVATVTGALRWLRQPSPGREL